MLVLPGDTRTEVQTHAHELLTIAELGGTAAAQNGPDRRGMAWFKPDQEGSGRMPYPDDPVDIRGSIEQLVRQARQHAAEVRREAANTIKRDAAAAAAKLRMAADLDQFARRYEAQLADWPEYGARRIGRRAP